MSTIYHFLCLSLNHHIIHGKGDGNGETDCGWPLEMSSNQNIEHDL